MAAGGGIRVEGLEALERQVQVLSPKGRRRVWRAAFRGAGQSVIQKGARDELKAQGHRSLGKGLRTKAKAKGTQITATIGAKAGTQLNRIGHLLEFGTKAHPVRPRDAKVLRLGEALFRVGVQHPGAKARSWLLMVLQRSREKVTADIARRIDKEVQNAKARGL